MRIAYIVNQYPAVSHSFIRREIQAIEKQGVTVCRVSIRPPQRPLVSAADRDEEGRTWCVLDGGASELASGALQNLRRRPGALLAATRFSLRLGIGSDRGMLRHLAYLAEACLIRDRLAAEDIDHVHAHFGTNTAAVAAMVRALGGPPFSFTAHGPEEFLKSGPLAIREKMARAAFVVAVSGDGERELRSIWRSQEHCPVRLVRCGIDESFLHARVSRVPCAPRLVYVGRLCAQKRPDLLVRAAAGLARLRGDVEVVIVGDGPERPRIQSMIAKLRAPVRLLGSLDAEGIRRELHRARALVLPSDAEGLPSVIMEAFALERPVVTTPVGGIPELVEHGVNGWLVPAGSVEGLISAAVEVLDADPASLQLMGQRGRQSVLELHDVNKNAETLVQLMRAAADAEVKGLSTQPAP